MRSIRGGLDHGEGDKRGARGTRQVQAPPPASSTPPAPRTADKACPNAAAWAPEIRAIMLTNSSGASPNASSRARAASGATSAAARGAAGRNRRVTSHRAASKAQAGNARFRIWSPHQRPTSRERAGTGPRPAGRHRIAQRFEVVLDEPVQVREEDRQRGERRRHRPNTIGSRQPRWLSQNTNAQRGHGRLVRQRAQAQAQAQRHPPDDLARLPGAPAGGRRAGHEGDQRDLVIVEMQPAVVERDAQPGQQRDQHTPRRACRAACANR